MSRNKYPGILSLDLLSTRKTICTMVFDKWFLIVKDYMMMLYSKFTGFCSITGSDVAIQKKHISVESQILGYMFSCVCISSLIWDPPSERHTQQSWVVLEKKSPATFA